MGCSDCGGGNKFSGHKTSNHSTKTMPNWGMTKKPSSTSSTQAARNAAGGFGQPKVRMSFGSRKR